VFQNEDAKKAANQITSICYACKQRDIYISILSFGLGPICFVPYILVIK